MRQKTRSAPKRGPSARPPTMSGDSLGMTKGECWSVPDERGWPVVARYVAASLRPGSILALQGSLGAGKTTFVQALAKVLGAKRIPKSPTFSMLRTHRVRRGAVRRLLHVDAYRIERERDLVPLDLDAELAAGDAILVLEWPERAAHWLKRHPHMTMRIKILKQGRRAEIRMTND